MKSNLDALMQAQHIDALLVTGSASYNPAMYYFTGPVHVSQVDLFKRCGQPPVLFCNSMERDEAAKTGLAIRDLSEFRLPDLLKLNNGDMTKALVQRYQKMLVSLGFTAGRMALYGKIEAGYALAVFTGLQQALPGLEIVGFADDPLLLQAMATKDADEVARIRRMGSITTEVVGLTASYLTSHNVEDEVLIKEDGAPLTIGDVKAKISLWLAERGADTPEGFIFAIGRDAGIPHSSGEPGDFLRLGRTIVFDIYPAEAGGGYFYDFTRTWCLGYAPPAAQQLYDQVRQVYDQLMSDLKSGDSCPEYQKRTCDLFEALGHTTIRQDPQTRQGYVHSLGHGVGLHIHERPWFRQNAVPADVLEPGSVVTIEPGLYYPERGLGMRLEDTIWVRPDGQMEILAPYPLDLVLPMK